MDYPVWSSLESFRCFWEEAAGHWVALQDTWGAVTFVVWGEDMKVLHFWVSARHGCVHVFSAYPVMQQPVYVHMWPHVSAGRHTLDLRDLYRKIARGREELLVQWLAAARKANPSTPLQRFLGHSHSATNDLTRLIFQLADRSEGIKP